VRPGAILPKVIQTGKPMAGIFRREGDIEYVVDMAPIVIAGRIVGGVSVLKDITEVKRLSMELKNFANRTDQLKSIIHHAYKAKYRFEDILGGSDAIRQVVRLSERIAHGENDILIFGESGTGKEVFAQSIHNESKRSSKPFIPISCATLTPTLIESELFGYEEGAFTGAKKGGKVGLFEIAEGGTIFLDEISELPLEMQAKLLRTLQERTIRRVGKTEESPVDVRVIAASNRDLEAMVKEGNFRQDLYYRLNVMSIHLPPLRDRAGDVRKMADHFLEKLCARMQRHLKFSPEVYALLSHYRWPGNIRELIHVVEFSANMSEDVVIHVRDLPRALRPDPALNMIKGNSLAEIIRNVERKIIEERMKSYGITLSSKKRLANDLGISLASLYNKIKVLGVKVENK
jgi:transcriptional regulator with PAS, ATPase and Fis domain